MTATKMWTEHEWWIYYLPQSISQVTRWTIIAWSVGIMLKQKKNYFPHSIRSLFSFYDYSNTSLTIHIVFFRSWGNANWSVVLINPEADYDKLSKLSFWRNSGEVWGFGGLVVANFVFFLEKLVRCFTFSVWAFTSMLWHLWRSLQY